MGEDVYGMKEKASTKKSSLKQNLPFSSPTKSKKGL